MLAIGLEIAALIGAKLERGRAARLADADIADLARATWGGARAILPAVGAARQDIAAFAATEDERGRAGRGADAGATDRPGTASLG